jgi:DNA-directed RNA polymerase specialized sigma subunit
MTQKKKTDTKAKTSIKKNRRPKATSEKGHYITNATLLPAVLEAKKLGKITDTLAKMFLMITEKYSKKSSFIGYSFRDDMISAALMNLCANGLKFDPKKSSNPFAFYTTMIHNSFLQYMAEEKKHRTIRDELILELGSTPSNTYIENAHDEYIKEHNIEDEYLKSIQYTEINKISDTSVYNCSEYNDNENIHNLEKIKSDINTRKKKSSSKQITSVKKEKVQKQKKKINKNKNNKK